MEGPLCQHCGDVIGVYEPAIAIVEGKPRETSRAAESELREADVRYHQTCFKRLQDAATGP